MAPAGGGPVSWPTDEELCTATYPGRGTDFGLLCNEPLEHSTDHRALAEVAAGYRRHVVWSLDGTVMPDIETSASNRTQRELPQEGDCLT